MIPPADRQILSHFVKSMEHGKPDYSRTDLCCAESSPQGMPMDKRAEDVGKSECRAVMGRIGVQDLP